MEANVRPIKGRSHDGLVSRLVNDQVLRSLRCQRTVFGYLCDRPLRFALGSKATLTVAGSKGELVSPQADC